VGLYLADENVQEGGFDGDPSWEEISIVQELNNYTVRDGVAWLMGISLRSGNLTGSIAGNHR
jgi:hypothetical protein